MSLLSTAAALAAALLPPVVVDLRLAAIVALSLVNLGVALASAVSTPASAEAPAGTSECLSRLVQWGAGIAGIVGVTAGAEVLWPACNCNT